MEERETSAEIDAAAAEWAVRVDHAPLADDEQADLDAWLAGDTRRLGAYARARAMYAHARRAKALGADFDPDAFITASGHTADRPDVEDEPGGSQDAFDAREEPGVSVSRPTRRRLLWLGGSAAAAGIVGMVGFSWQAAAHTYTTRRGEIRLIPLDDGSSMTLNTESTARVRYDDRQRHVELVQGEALFDVVKDPQRPFVVAAGDTDVRAVGTSFSVSRLVDKPVKVTVRQGVVEVLRPDQPRSVPERLAANTQATITAVSAAAIADPTPIATRVLPPDEVNRVLAWREGMLSFEDLPLSQAADEFARYSDVRIRFADPSIGSESVTGLYAANNPSGFAKAVALSLGLQARTTSDGVIIGR